MNRKLAGFAASLLMSVSLASCGSTVESAHPQSEDASAYTQGGNTASAPQADTGRLSVTGAPEENTKTIATEPETEPFSMDVSTPEGYSIPDKYVIEGFEAVLQEPELPSGCEITSLTETLNYLGFDVDKMTMAFDFMPIDLAGYTLMDEAYIGDPRYDGFGCNANVIVQTADKYFASVDSPCYGVDLTGTEFSDLFWQISEGRPVLVWTTIDLHESYPELVWTAGNGEDFYFDWWQHCMVIYGYDKAEDTVYAADPLNGNVTYSLSQFNRMYDVLGKQAVMICGDASTEGHHITTEAEKSITCLSYNEQKEKELVAVEDVTDEIYVYEEAPVPEEER